MTYMTGLYRDFMTFPFLCLCMPQPVYSQGSADPLPYGQDIGEPVWKEGEGNGAP